MGLNVQYGCGLSAPEGWLNFDASPTLRLQKIPLAGKLIKKVIFPPNVRYGDIVKGLPGIQNQSCDALYCSHVLEHLSLNDFRTALKQSYQILKPGAIFRCVMPDLEAIILEYIKQRDEGLASASIEFLKSTMLGIEARPGSLKKKIMAVFGNSQHLWMWDQYSLEAELISVGFGKVRKADFNDSENLAFKEVEERGRFWRAICFEAVK